MNTHRTESHRPSHRSTPSTSIKTIAATLLLVGGAGAWASDWTPVPGWDLAAGVACRFPILLEQRGEQTGLNRSFFDRQENFVKFMATGTGVDYRISNTTNRAAPISLYIPAKGALVKVSPGPNEQLRVQIDGQSILALFPTDKPAGPSTTLLQGRLVANADPVTGATEVLQMVGEKFDLCAAIAD